jgi:hypothetical protein
MMSLRNYRPSGVLSLYDTLTGEHLIVDPNDPEKKMSIDDWHAKNRSENSKNVYHDLTSGVNVVVGAPYVSDNIHYGAGGNGGAPEGWSMMTQIDYKYNEGQYLTELRTYIDSTYSQHYSKNQFQATEFIIDSGHGTGFCIGNVLKYAQRYGRKGTPEDWRKDLMKVIHYAIIQLHVHDLENSKGEK